MKLKRSIILTFAAALAAACAYFFLAPPSPAPAEQTDDTAKLCSFIAGEETKYRNDLLAMLATFKASEAPAAGNDFAPVFAAIPSASAELSSWKNCSKITFLLAKDGFTGANEAGGLISEKLAETIFAPCFSAEHKADGRLRDFLLRVNERTSLFHASVAAYSVPPENTDKAENLSLSGMQSAAVGLAGTASASAGAAINVLLEALFIRTTVNCFSRVMASSVARLSCGAAAAGTAAVADGPLPIGDIAGAVFATACIAWTAYDVDHARNVLPSELESSLETSVSRIKAKTSERNISVAEKYVAAALDSASKWKASVLNGVK